MGIGWGKPYWIWYFEKNPTHLAGYFSGHEAAAEKANAISRIRQQNYYVEGQRSSCFSLLCPGQLTARKLHPVLGIRF